MYWFFPCQRVLGGAIVVTTKDQYWAVFITVIIPTMLIAGLFHFVINATLPTGL